MNKAQETYRKNLNNDAVVQIKDATKNKGEFTRPYPLGYSKIDEAIMGGVRAGDLVVGTGLSGAGKCLAPGTKILMYDGSIKKVENIIVGDKIMGDDSKPRNILSIINGEEEMFDIIPTKGEKYTVNRSHILSLKNNHSNAYNGKGIIDISVNDYLKKGRWWKAFHVGYKTGVKFKNNNIPIDPYFLGLWIGDGHSSGPRITTMDNKIVEWLEKYANSINHSVKKTVQKNNRSSIYSITRDRFIGGAVNEKTIKNGKFYVYKSRYGNNATGFGNIKSLQSIMGYIGIINNKHIPNLYKCNSRSIRLSVLAGIIDSDGYQYNNCLEICQKSKLLSDDIVYLVRSLGIGCNYIKSKVINGVKYYRISIYGDTSEIPVLLDRKKCKKRRQVKNPLHYGIKIESVGIGKYYGFEIDGNKRFLLGDFTVTHNTTMFQNILVNLSDQGLPCLYFSYEVLLDNLYAKFKQMGVEENLKAYTPKQNTSGNLKWVKEKIIEGLEKYNTKFIFIDHIDYLAPAKSNGSSEQRRIVLRDICQELKNMAIELEIVVFLISHVKKVQGRSIEMQDITESASIYQLADLVLVAEREMISTESLGRKVDVFGDNSMIRILKNRVTGEYAEVNFILKDNIIMSEDDMPQDLSLFDSRGGPQITVETIEPDEIIVEDIEIEDVVIEPTNLGI